MMRYEIAGRAPTVDARRAFHGQSQLSARDCRILAQGRNQCIQVSHERNGTAFWCAGIKLPKVAVLRLLRLKYLIAGSDGLLPGLGQTLLVNSTVPTIR